MASAAPLAMDRRDRGTHMLVEERKQPSDALALVEVEAERLDEDHVGEVLCDQDASRLEIGQFLPHPIEGPAQSLAISLALQMDESTGNPVLLLS
jgi:hypothetical protein